MSDFKDVDNLKSLFDTIPSDSLRKGELKGLIQKNLEEIDNVLDRILTPQGQERESKEALEKLLIRTYRQIYEIGADPASIDSIDDAFLKE